MGRKGRVNVYTSRHACAARPIPVCSGIRTVDRATATGSAIGAIEWGLRGAGCGGRRGADSDAGGWRALRPRRALAAIQTFEQQGAGVFAERVGGRGHGSERRRGRGGKPGFGQREYAEVGGDREGELVRRL